MQGLFIFQDGKFTAGDPLSLEQSDDIEKAIAAKGFYPAQHFGDDCGFSFVVHEGEEGWFVFLNSPGKWCGIAVNEWPSLMQLLSMLAPIPLAGLINSTEKGRPACFPVTEVVVRR